MLNVVTLVGNLGQDPEVRHTQTGTAIANMSLAVTEHFKDQNGNQDKRTHWFKLVAFGRTAEVAAQYLHKGSKIGISGSLSTREWVDKDEQKRSVTEIRVNQLEFLETKPVEPVEQGQQGQRQQNQQQRPSSHQQDTSEDYSEIPF